MSIVVEWGVVFNLEPPRLLNIYSVWLFAAVLYIFETVISRYFWKVTKRWLCNCHLLNISNCTNCTPGYNIQKRLSKDSKLWKISSYWSFKKKHLFLETMPDRIYGQKQKNQAVRDKSRKLWYLFFHSFYCYFQKFLSTEVTKHLVLPSLQKNLRFSQYFLIS